ncbi:hypothetical protein DMC01_03180 [Campylobacter troglodytis]|nr:hypothetical protein DMC01_03180 [Campylobacter troglodytis]
MLILRLPRAFIIFFIFYPKFNCLAFIKTSLAFYLKGALNSNFLYYFFEKEFLLVAIMTIINYTLLTKKIIKSCFK